MKSKNTIKDFSIITLGMFIVSAAVYFFLIPSEIVVGSISGLSMVLSQLLGIPISLITFILNAVLLVIGFIFIGKDFGAKTIYTSMLLPVFLWIFEMLFPFSGSLTQNQVFDLAAYILIVALGQALLFHVNADVYKRQDTMSAGCTGSYYVNALSFQPKLYGNISCRHIRNHQRNH